MLEHDTDIKQNANLEVKRFREAVQFLKKTTVTKHHQKEALYTADWCMILGSAQSGKTSLLKNSDIHFYLSRKSDTSLAHDEVNWWVSKQAVFLDLPSCYLNPERETSLKQLAKLTKKYAFQNRLATIILTISVKDLFSISKDEPSSLSTSLNQLLKTATKHFHGTTPVYLLVNKCDLLSGFCEYFKSLAKDERFQPWGMLLHTQPKESLIEEASAEFDLLLQRLNQQLIWRLHHEPEMDNRNEIKDFPVQLAHIKPALIEFLRQLTSTWKKYHLAGIYFTSAIQQPPQAQSKPAANSLIIKAVNPKSKGYFIHDLLNQVIPAQQSAGGNSFSFNYRNLAPYFAGIGAVIAVGVFFFTVYSNDRHRIEEAYTLLQKYQLNSQLTQDATTRSKELIELSQVSDLLVPKHAWSVALPGEGQNKAIFANINKLYQQQLNQFLLPDIKASLENSLSSTSFNPAVMYAVLKSYLMLAQPAQFNSAYFFQTVSALWQNDSSEHQILLRQLQQIIDQHPLSTTINPQLVAQARADLTQLPAETRALAIINAQFINTPVLTLNLQNNKKASQLFDLRDKEVGISSLYTMDFYKQFNALLKPASLAAISGDWVTGPLSPQPGASSEAIQQQVRLVYDQNYAKAWQAFLDNIQIKSFTHFDELHDVLDNLNGSSSLMLQLTKLFQDNIPQEVIRIDPEISHFMQLGGQDQQVKKAFADLSNYFKDADKPENLFKLTKARMLSNGVQDPITNLMNLSAHYPAPIQAWLYQIAQNTWQLMLNESLNYMNQIWQQTIWTPYSNQMANHYPFEMNSNNDMSLASFTNFFAPNGLFDQFFMNYVQPFVDTNTKHWQMIALNGAVLNMKPTTLHDFQRIHFLRKLFFPNNDQHVFLPMTLLPLKYSSNLTSVTFKLGAQQTTFTSGRHSRVFGISWPDDTDNNTLLVQFNGRDGSNTPMNFTGPWGLWRFMQQSDLTKAHQRKHWIGTASTQNDESFVFLVGTKQRFNPFSKQYLMNFKLDNSL